MMEMKQIAKLKVASQEASGVRTIGWNYRLQVWSGIGRIEKGVIGKLVLKARQIDRRLGARLRLYT